MSASVSFWPHDLFLEAEGSRIGQHLRDKVGYASRERKARIRLAGMLNGESPPNMGNFGS